MRIKITFFATVFILGAIYAHSQGFTQYKMAGNQGASINYAIAPDPEDIDGDPYYNSEWQKGVIYNRDMTYTEIEELKYNVYANELVFKMDGEEYLFPNKEKVRNFKLGKDEFVGAFDRDNTYSFYKVLVPGEKISLLQKYKGSIKKGEPSKGYVPATNDKYEIDEELYFKQKNKDAVQVIPRKEEEILNYMQDKNDELKKYMKEEKLKLKREDDLKALFKYYNSLFEEEAG